MEITYILKNGKEVTREYSLPVFENEDPDPNSLIYKYEEINNTPEFILSRELPDQEVTAAGIRDCEINYILPDMHYSERMDLTAAEAYRLWTEAMLPDFKAGNMGTIYQTRRVRPVESVEVEAVPTYSEVSVQIEMYGEDRTHHYYYTIPASAANTMAALIEMGVPAEAFMIPEGT